MIPGSPFRIYDPIRFDSGYRRDGIRSASVRSLFKGGTEAALTAETGLEADILDGDLRKVQKIFCIVYPCQDHVFMRRESSLFLKKTTEIKGLKEAWEARSFKDRISVR